MPEYQLIRFDEQGQVKNRIYLACESDAEAIEKARFIYGDDEFECWQSQRRVFPSGISKS